MKKVSILSLFILAGSCISAQTIVTPASKDPKHVAFLQQLLAVHTGAVLTLEKTTQQYERLIAMTDHTGQVLEDSTTYRYGSNNHSGSQFDYVILGYPDIMDESPANNILAAKVNGLHGYHNRLYVPADTIRYYNSSTTDPLNRQYLVAYDTSYNATMGVDSTYGGQSGLYFSFAASYDAQNKLTDCKYFTWLNNAVDTIAERTFTYNAGTLVADSVFNVPSTIPQGIDVYTYDTAGDLVTLTAYQNNVLYSRYLLSYTTAHLLKMSEYDLYNANSNTWDVNTIDSFQYTNGKMMEWDETDAANSYQSIIDYRLSASGLPDTVYNYTTNGDEVKVITYDMYNNPTEIDIYGLSYTYYGNTVFYYEDYTPKLSVNNVNAVNDIKVFPNPVTNSISVSGLEGKGGTIAISNIIGQTLIEQQITDNASIHTVPVSGLAPGTYIMNLTDANGNVHTKRLIKQ